MLQKQNHTVFLFGGAWFLLPMIIILRFMHVMHVSIVQFLLLSSTALNRHTSTFLLIHLVVDIWAISSLGLLKQNCNEQSHMSLCPDTLFLFLLGKHLGEESLDHMVSAS
jgi:hypothetical protein